MFLHIFRTRHSNSEKFRYNGAQKKFYAHTDFKKLEGTLVVIPLMFQKFDDKHWPWVFWGYFIVLSWIFHFYRVASPVVSRGEGRGFAWTTDRWSHRWTNDDVLRVSQQQPWNITPIFGPSVGERRRQHLSGPPGRVISGTQWAVLL